MGRYKDLISKPNFNGLTIFAEDMVIIEINRLKIKFNKPIYSGFCILDLSEIILCDFHYDYIKENFENMAKLLYTDTYNLIYEFTDVEIYESMKRDIDLFDTLIIRKITSLVCLV